MTQIDKILKKRKVSFFLKRLIDIVASGLGLIILAIPMLIFAIIIKLDSKGPVFFKQVRIGKNHKPFEIYKFRTMCQDAPKKGAQITIGKDNRITKLGVFLRKYKIDEFPQLINVFKGEMSLVGPRPEVEKYVALYDDNMKEILKVKPGITDLASIEYKDESTLLGQSDDPEKTYIEKIMPDKIRLNVEYLKNFSVIYDIKLILRTFIAVFKE